MLDFEFETPAATVTRPNVPTSDVGRPMSETSRHAGRALARPVPPTRKDVHRAAPQHDTDRLAAVLDGAQEELNRLHNIVRQAGYAVVFRDENDRWSSTAPGRTSRDLKVAR